MWLSSTLLTKIIKYLFVGGTSVLIDVIATYLLKEKAKFGKYFANTVGLLLSSAYNFTLNRLWTFHSQDQNIQLQIVWFTCSVLFNLVASNLLIYLFTEKLKFNFYIAKFWAIGIMLIFNFSINNLFIFAR